MSISREEYARRFEEAFGEKKEEGPTTTVTFDLGVCGEVLCDVNDHASEDERAMA
jgi:hypothetical protein